MKVFCFILSMLVVFLATRPCCSDDDCLETETVAHHSQEQDNHQCGLCSPFMACGSCTGFSFSSFKLLEIVDNPLQVLCSVRIYTYSSYFLNTYSADIWQPPQVA